MQYVVDGGCYGGYRLMSFVPAEEQQEPEAEEEEEEELTAAAAATGAALQPPPPSGRIAEAELLEWATVALLAAGAEQPSASHVARCLVDVDLRGVKSHGTRLLQRYVREFEDGAINPAPTVGRAT